LVPPLCSGFGGRAGDFHLDVHSNCPSLRKVHERLGHPSEQMLKTNA
jgi:hypothetical protein